MSYTIPDDYLRKYQGTYRVARSADGVWELPLRWKRADFGMEYSVYPFSDTLLAALVPHKAGLGISRRFPGVFQIHQEAQDGTVLLFEEKNLEGMVGVLRVRRKRHRSLSEEEREALIDAGAKFRFSGSSDPPQLQR